MLFQMECLRQEKECYVTFTDILLYLFVARLKKNLKVNQWPWCNKVNFALCLFTVYKSPQYETMGFNLVKQRLLQMGYPIEMQEFVYDPSFPIR